MPTDYFKSQLCKPGKQVNQGNLSPKSAVHLGITDQYPFPKELISKINDGCYGTFQKRSNLTHYINIVLILVIKEVLILSMQRFSYS